MRVLIAALCLLCIPGCIKVGPNFKAPITQSQYSWTEQSEPLHEEATPALQWWQAFGDETLNALVNYALQENYTLEAAVDRIIAARAHLGFAIGEWFPQTFQLEGSALRTHISENAPNAANINRNYWDIISGLRVNWELDFWGRYARGIEEACGEYRASIDDFRDIQRLVIADVVINYVQLKTLMRRIATLESNIAIQYRSVQITEARWEGGFESQLDFAQAGALWKETAARKENLEIQKKAVTTSLAILLGMTPERFICSFKTDQELNVPRDAEISFPAEVLTQRPDLRRSLDKLYAQNARVGIAVSDLYPRISFTGFLGFETTGKDFLSKSSLTYFFGPSFTWQFFSFGRVQNRIREQCALLCEGIALYRNQVLIAFKEVEDALTAFVRSIQETQELEESYAFAKRSVEISTIQYQEGIADYSRVLNSLQLQVEAQDRLDQAHGDIAIAYANIYKSLGVLPDIKRKCKKICCK